jgi:hypothetical protein
MPTTMPLRPILTDIFAVSVELEQNHDFHAHIA